MRRNAVKSLRSCAFLCCKRNGVCLLNEERKQVFQVGAGVGESLCSVRNGQCILVKGE